MSGEKGGRAAGEGAGAESMREDQAAALRALEAGAAGGEVGGEIAPGAADSGIPEPSRASLEAAAIIVSTLRPVMCFVFKDLKGAPNEVWEPIPSGVAGLLDHYGIGEAEIMRNPWARMALCTVPLVGYVIVTAEKTAPKEAGAVAAPSASGQVEGEVKPVVMARG